MLKVAPQLEMTLVELMFIDTKYCQELESGSDIPTTLDWEKTPEVAQFLKVFKAFTLHISGSTSVTSNMYLGEVF